MTSISETYTENRERVQPDDTNNYGTAHGGNVVKWMDEVGVMSAMRHAGENCVTARISELNFTRPVPQVIPVSSRRTRTRPASRASARG